MTNLELKNKLQDIANQKENTIEKAVAIEVTSWGDDEIINSFSNILDYGSEYGMVSSFVYYADTHEFFDTHYRQIEELRYEFAEEFSFLLNTNNDLKHSLAWFGFQQTAFNIANELGLEI